MKAQIVNQKVVVTCAIIFGTYVASNTIYVDIESTTISPNYRPTENDVFEALCNKVKRIEKSCQEGLCVTLFEQDASSKFAYIQIPSNKFTQVSALFGDFDFITNAADCRYILAALCDYTDEKGQDTPEEFLARTGINLNTK